MKSKRGKVSQHQPDIMKEFTYATDIEVHAIEFVVLRGRDAEEASIVVVGRSSGLLVFVICGYTGY